MNQYAKEDNGKLQLSLVPRQIIKEIAKVRMYGTEKYHNDPDNWKTVEPKRFRDAAFRHFLAYLDDPHGVDEESGLSHLSHLACNIAFLCELESIAKREDRPMTPEEIAQMISGNNVEPELADDGFIEMLAENGSKSESSEAQTILDDMNGGILPQEEIEALLQGMKK